MSSNRISIATTAISQALTSPQELLSYLLDQSNPDHDLASLKHRQDIVSAWKIPTGSSILEIGCGQGDFTVVLADAVGPDGRVVAIDSCPLDWGRKLLSLS